MQIARASQCPLHDISMHFTARMENPGDRLRKSRMDAGFTNAREAADALGVNYSTYGQHENGTRAIPARRAIHYARRFKVSVDWLLTGRGNAATELGKTSRVDLVRVVGTVKAGAWQDVDDSRGESMSELVPSVGDYPIEWQYAFIVDGESLNKVARPGDRLVCLDLIKAQIDIADGDLVIVERSRYAGQMVERTAKRVRKTIAGTELWPESTDPQFQGAIPYSTGNAETDGVEVKAKVIWILRRP